MQNGDADRDTKRSSQQHSESRPDCNETDFDATTRLPGVPDPKFLQGQRIVNTGRMCVGFSP
jgi:hypothetical protein